MINHNYNKHWKQNFLLTQSRALILIACESFDFNRLDGSIKRCVGLSVQTMTKSSCDFLFSKLHFKKYLFWFSNATTE